MPKKEAAIFIRIYDFLSSLLHTTICGYSLLSGTPIGVVEINPVGQENYELIKDEQESKFGGRRYIWLTDKGN